MNNGQDRILIFPPIPGQGPGPVIPLNPWLPLNPGLPQFPPIGGGNDTEILTVRIKSVIEDEFVIVGNDNFLYATGVQVTIRGIFNIIILRGNRVILRSLNGRFIRVDNRDLLVADTDRRGATRFNIFQAGNREYVLQAPNGFYVRTRERDKILIARAENPGPRTRFKFRTIV